MSRSHTTPDFQPRAQTRRVTASAGYGLVVADECHHVPAAAFEDAVRQIPARRWLGLTATPYRRDKLDDLIGWQVGSTRHTISTPGRHDAIHDDELALPGIPTETARPVLCLHATAYCYEGDADPQAPGGMAAIYRDLTADDKRTRQVTADVTAGKVGPAEVDFVARRQEDTIYVQVATTIAASAGTRRREYAPLEAIADNHPKYVLTLDPLAGDRTGGIHHLPTSDFLLSDTY